MGLAAPRVGELPLYRPDDGSTIMGKVADRSALTVLVVDDQPAFHVATRRMLAHAADFELVGEAHDGADALRLASLLHPDVILMDIKLPDESGIEATRHILEVERSATVVLLSTYTSDDLPAGAATSGAVAYLHKEDLAAPVLRSVLAGTARVATFFS